ISSEKGPDFASWFVFLQMQTDDGTLDKLSARLVKHCGLSLLKLYCPHVALSCHSSTVDTTR
ncbi:hypothetical protein KUCAC02_002950, partial [Chaenocephalus aceratus]